MYSFVSFEKHMQSQYRKVAPLQILHVPVAPLPAVTGLFSVPIVACHLECHVSHGHIYTSGSTRVQCLDGGSLCCW